MRQLEKYPNIDTLLPSQAPSSSTASTRSPLLCPTVSSTQSFDPFDAICPDEYRNDPRNPNKNLKPAH
ncbi:hypothetical protein E4T50_15303 [Aureobasidium sp. EXF-12298]|nr:hypothetical protein E4T50_15303 [Aureobasidium sp. EXF-12298]KAI4754735.1 hypothetical protein E4T51_12165 [Aureobasidium sp. EXF-12344]KAI4770415.1 hypothetical protein E4T52_14565 [Aureobasidium sp. EXF-3400]